MLDAALNRIQQGMIDRQSAARRAGRDAEAKAWADALELVQQEKRRSLGVTETATDRGAA
jgi:hypothetical protein